MANTLNAFRNGAVGFIDWRHTGAILVTAENSVRVLPWHSIRLASESRSKPYPHHHPFLERPQPISAAAVEHSAIERTPGAIRAPLRLIIRNQINSRIGLLCCRSGGNRRVLNV